MNRVLAGLLLGLLQAAGWCVVPAEEQPPRLLTTEERKALEAKWQEQVLAGVRHYQAGKFAEATQALEKALEIARRLYPNQDHPNLALSLDNLAFVLVVRSKHAAAEPLYREALATRRRMHPKKDHPDVALSLKKLAVVLHGRGNYVDAEPLYREALAMRRRLYPKQDHPLLAESLNDLTLVLRDQGKYAD